MSTITAFDMGKHWRIVGIDHETIKGDLFLMKGKDDEVWIEFRDITVWDEGHHFGQTFKQADFKGRVFASKVAEGIFDLHDRDFSERALPVFREHEALFEKILGAAVQAAAYQPDDFSSQIVVEA